MDFEIPDWLTKEFIKSALENGKEYKILIQDMKIDMPVPKGDNYSTDVYGVKVDYTRSNDLNKIRKKSFIIKSPIKGPMYGDLLKSGYIQKETVVYNEFLPKLRSILGEDDDDDEDDDTNEKDKNLLAKSYRSLVEYILVLEDLKVKGYKMAQRQKQLDYDHCVVTLKALAKFHAGSVVLHEKEPQFIEKIVGKESLFDNEFKNSFFEFFTNNLKIVANMLKGYPEMKKYSKWFEENSEKSWDCIIKEIHVNNKNDFKVLNHGDFWITNMLFKYNDQNEPIKNIPVDLQVCRYASPAVDFTYFIEGSVQENVRDEYFDDLIAVYIKELNSNLEKYGSSKRLKESEFRNMLRQIPYYRIFTNVTILPGVLADPNKTKLFDVKEISVNDLKDLEKSPMADYFRNEKYWEIMSKRLTRFEKEGLITATKS